MLRKIVILALASALTAAPFLASASFAASLSQSIGASITPASKGLVPVCNQFVLWVKDDPNKPLNNPPPTPFVCTYGIGTGYVASSHATFSSLRVNAGAYAIGSHASKKTVISSRASAGASDDGTVMFGGAAAPVGTPITLIACLDGSATATKDGNLTVGLSGTTARNLIISIDPTKPHQCKQTCGAVTTDKLGRVQLGPTISVTPSLTVATVAQTVSASYSATFFVKVGKGNGIGWDSGANHRPPVLPLAGLNKCP